MYAGGCCVDHVCRFVGELVFQVAESLIAVGRIKNCIRVLVDLTVLCQFWLLFFTHFAKWKQESVFASRFRASLGQFDR